MGGRMPDQVPSGQDGERPPEGAGPGTAGRPPDAGPDTGTRRDAAGKSVSEKAESVKAVAAFADGEVGVDLGVFA